MQKRSRFERLTKADGLEEESGVPSVQRSGPAALKPPSLLQQPDPASRYRLGGDYQLQLDPALLASVRQLVEQQLDPTRVLPALSQVNALAPIPAAAPNAAITPTPATGSAPPTTQGASSATPLAGSPTPAPTPVVPAGTGPDEPRAASVGDLTKAIMAVPAIDQALARLRLQATQQVERDWDRLNTGERVGVVSTLAVIGAGAIGGIASDPVARASAFGLLNGRPLPVPGLDWMRVEVNTAGENVMVGLHVDVGSLLPASLGFGAGSAQPIGAPPIPGQRAVADTETGEAAEPEPDLARRITDAAGDGAPLSAAERSRLEQTLDADLSAVRVHTDARASALARAVGATAFTTGQDIFFREGAYAPATTDGLHLLAHEATHTVQQARGPVEGTLVTGGVALSDPGDRYERAAERTADRVIDEAAAPNVVKARRGHDFADIRVNADVSTSDRATRNEVTDRAD